MAIGDKLETGITIALIGGIAYAIWYVKKNGFMQSLDTLFSGDSNEKVNQETQNAVTGGLANKPVIADVVTPVVSNMPYEAIIPGISIYSWLAKSMAGLMNYNQKTAVADATGKTTASANDWSWAMSSNPDAVKSQLGVSIDQKKTSNDSQAINQTIQGLADARASGSNVVQLTPTITASRSAVESGKVVLVKATGSEAVGSYAAQADSYIANKAAAAGINTKGMTQTQVVSALNKSQIVKK